MRDQKMSRKSMAKLMHTSLAQLRRVLHPHNSNVTIETLQRAAVVVGRKLQMELV